MGKEKRTRPRALENKSKTEPTDGENNVSVRYIQNGIIMNKKMRQNYMNGWVHNYKALISLMRMKTMNDTSNVKKIFKSSPVTASPVCRATPNDDSGTYRRTSSLTSFNKCSSEENIFDLANCFLSIQSMTNKKLQKLCYYAQAWHLALTGSPLVNNRFEAWIHGPVCPELYTKYRSYGYKDIPKQLGDGLSISEEIKAYADMTFEAYGHLTENDLEKISHTETPWLEARNGLEPWVNCSKEISWDSMKQYYREQ